MTMRRALRRRFWVEAGLAVITLVLAIATAIWPTWIELVFGVDPDEGSGALEWAIVATLALVTLATTLAAGFEWRHARSAVLAGGS
jgi:hypothetical protein